MSTDDPRQHRDGLAQTMTQIATDLWEHIQVPERLAIVSSPPGAGKTRTLVEVCRRALAAGRRVGVACQTNAQADDVCCRLADALQPSAACRFQSSTASPTPPTPGCHVATGARNVPEGPLVVVGTTMKWALVKDGPQIDCLIADEAWQMAMASFIPLLRFSGSLLLIGDPGQIPPVVAASTKRWETSRNPPHIAAPEVLLARLNPLHCTLPATWRLPFDTASVIRDFYDFDFESASCAGERSLRLDAASHPDDIDRAIDRLQYHSMSRLLVPMPRAGGVTQADKDVARAAAEAVVRLLDRSGQVTKSDRGVQAQRLGPASIGVAASHRVMVQEITAALPDAIRADVKVDTAERWQGLERDVMVVVHPLSSMVNPGSFDLETGRLCVMASRHEVGLLVVGRDHIGETLAKVLPAAEQPIGRPDIVAAGLQRHREFWQHLEQLENNE